MSILPKDFATTGCINPPKSLDIREIPQPAVQTFNDSHPLENRVANWKANEEAFKMKLLQRTQGSAEPIRRTMELKIIEDSTFVPSLVGGPSNVHLDILKNTDTSIDWDDVYTENDNRFDFHEELQRRMAI